MAALGPPARLGPLETVAPLVLAICHDLAGPLATAALGLDLLNEGGAASDEAAGVIAEGVAALKGRLDFLRVAHGRGDAVVARETIEAAARVLNAGGKTRLAFELPSEIVAPVARLALHLAQLGAASLPAGGAVTIAARARRMEGRAEGKGARMSAAAAGGLAGEPAPPIASADFARGLAVALAAAALGGAARAEAEPGLLRYVVETPEPIG